jgi:nitronate monooxygenase
LISAGLATALTRDARIEVPIICGAMYPCSNPELVGAVSAAGGLGVVQPISLTYVYGHEFREGLRLTSSMAAGRPIGMNALIEKSSRRYHEKMVRWVEIGLEEGVRFFVTSLGNPRWVVDRVHAAGGRVYHDVTERKWALKAIEGGVDGLIAVNRRAGGHPGESTATELLEELHDLGLPIVCAGGVGTEREFVNALDLGYAGVQMGTRFIATVECGASDAYKQAVVRAGEDDIVWSERITGTPVAVIRTPVVERVGTRAGKIEKFLLKGRRTRRWMRTFYALRSIRQLKRASLDDSGAFEYWQAGRSVAGVTAVESAGEIVRRFATAGRTVPASGG